jgi:hypothetical protein
MIASSSEVTTTNNSFVLGGPVMTAVGTLITGQNLAAYTVLGRITASGKLTKAVDSASDGSQTPMGILIHAVDASAADKDCQFYTGGKFNKSLVVWDATFTAIEQAQRFDRSPIILDTPT